MNAQEELLYGDGFAAGEAKAQAELAALRSDLQRITEEQAEAHNLIALLWALSDPDVVGEDARRRVEQILGMNDPDGHCGNKVCQMLADAERERDKWIDVSSQRAVWLEDSQAALRQVTEERNLLRHELDHALGAGASREIEVSEQRRVMLAKAGDDLEALFHEKEAAEAALRELREQIQRAGANWQGLKEAVPLSASSGDYGSYVRLIDELLRRAPQEDKKQS